MPLRVLSGTLPYLGVNALELWRLHSPGINPALVHKHWMCLVASTI